MPCVLSDVCNFPRVRHSVYNYRPSVTQLLRDLSVASPASRITAASYRRDRRLFDSDAGKGHAFFEYDEAREAWARRGGSEHEHFAIQRAVFTRPWSRSTWLLQPLRRGNAWVRYRARRRTRNAVPHP